MTTMPSEFISRVILALAIVVSSGCRTRQAGSANLGVASHESVAPPTAPAASPARDFIDSAPSVEPVAASDTATPEFDSLKAIARRSGVPESLIPQNRPGATAAAAPSGAAGDPASGAAASPPRTSAVPLVSGLRIVSTLVFPDGDRDNVVVTNVSGEGVTYAWHLRQQQDGKARDFDLKRFVRANDLAGAPRLNDVVGTDGPEETPGYTFISVSKSTYQKLKAAGEAPFTITGMDTGLFGGAFGALGATRVTYKGGFSVVSETAEALPVLLDGRRTTLPALHLRGKFAFQDVRQDGEYWLLADSAHPLILKEVNGTTVLQVVRIDRPTAGAIGLESELATSCRAELPGVYFGFASAALDPASMPALEQVAAMLQRHPDWALAVEGHTDSVGGKVRNQQLSEQRAEAVRSALVSRLGIPAGRLSAAGFGATRPRESNASVEGRARNRRVELVRRCEARG
jgi:outer membrane protein OmpA-like peptidoglycan-associated protein